MNWFDIAIVVIVLFGAYRGYKEGFLMELFSLLALILGILGAFKLLGVTLIFLSDKFQIDEKVLPYVAFGVVFLAIVILVNLLGRMIRLSIDKSFLGRVDEIAGAFLGGVKTVFMVSVVLWIIQSLKIEQTSEWISSSAITPYISNFAPDVAAFVSDYIPVFKDLF